MADNKSPENIHDPQSVELSEECSSETRTVNADTNSASDLGTEVMDVNDGGGVEPTDPADDRSDQNNSNSASACSDKIIIGSDSQMTPSSDSIKEHEQDNEQTDCGDSNTKLDNCEKSEVQVNEAMEECTAARIESTAVENSKTVVNEKNDGSDTSNKSAGENEIVDHSIESTAESNVEKVKMEPCDNAGVDTTGVSLMEYRSTDVVVVDENDSEDSSDDSEDSDEADNDNKGKETTDVQINKTLSNERDLSPDRERRVKLNRHGFEDVRTKGEILPDELPPLEELTITVDEAVHMREVGTVSSVVGILVVIQSHADIPPLDDDTILFVEGHKVLGQVFEVFGPVRAPWYSVRFNVADNITNKGIAVGTKVYCAPKEESFTKYVFVDSLKRLKGSDASWEDNNEPPEKHLEYSDDEEEKRAKSKRKNKNREAHAQDGDDEDAVQKNVEKKNRKNKSQCWPPKDNTNNKQNSGHNVFDRSSNYPPARGGNHPRYCRPQNGPQNNFRGPNPRWAGARNMNPPPPRFGGPPRFMGRPQFGNQQQQNFNNHQQQQNFNNHQQQQNFNNHQQQQNFNNPQQQQNFNNPQQQQNFNNPQQQQNFPSHNVNNPQVNNLNSAQPGMTAPRPPVNFGTGGPTPPPSQSFMAPGNGPSMNIPPPNQQFGSQQFGNQQFGSQQFGSQQFGSQQTSLPFQFNRPPPPAGYSGTNQPTPAPLTNSNPPPVFNTNGNQSIQNNGNNFQTNRTGFSQNTNMFSGNGNPAPQNSTQNNFSYGVNSLQNAGTGQPQMNRNSQQQNPKNGSNRFPTKYKVHALNPGSCSDQPTTGRRQYEQVSLNGNVGPYRPDIQQQTDSRSAPMGSGNQGFSGQQTHTQMMFSVNQPGNVALPTHPGVTGNVGMPGAFNATIGTGQLSGQQQGQIVDNRFMQNHSQY